VGLGVGVRRSLVVDGVAAAAAAGDGVAVAAAAAAAAGAVSAVSVASADSTGAAGAFPLSAGASFLFEPERKRALRDGIS
jgi:hypothetical protein